VDEQTRETLRKKKETAEKVKKIAEDLRREAAKTIGESPPGEIRDKMVEMIRFNLERVISGMLRRPVQVKVRHAKLKGGRIDMRMTARIEGSIPVKVERPAGGQGK